MAQKAIREYDAKRILQERWGDYFGDTVVYAGKAVQVSTDPDWDQLKTENGWLQSGRLAVKPDQLIGKRGKNGLILLDADFETAKKWVLERMNKPVTIGQVTGVLRQFIIEPFLPQKVEYYLAIKSDRAADTIHFSPSGGVDIEENWDKVVSIPVPVGTSVDALDVAGKLPDSLSGAEKEFFSTFIRGIFKLYCDLHFTFLEFNPLAVNGNKVVPLDTKARLDDTASYLCGKKWCAVSFPPPFGREPFPEESYIKDLDGGTGASLKLTILNPKARIWTMNAGGGASVVYTDTIVDLGFANDLANYGEYSGNPTTEFTYKYARTILDLFTREKDPSGKPKTLIVGGGIANFTDVANTLTGIVQALREYRDKLKAVGARIYLRRGGPNWREGLAKIRELGKELGIPISVHGPEMHMTRIVSMALEER
jgi:ATP-citrate lyase beta-subunit